MNTIFDISVIVPTYKGSRYLAALHSQLVHVLACLVNNYEIIFIDDGNEDDTYDILETIHKKDKHVKIIRFSKNFGQHAALFAGVNMAKGEIVITMDDDMKNNLNDISRFLEKISQGYEIVFGRRKQRKDPLFRIAGSYAVNLAASFFMGVRIYDIGCGFSALTKKALRSFVESGSIFGFLREVRRFKFTEIDVRCSPALCNSRYNLFNLAKLALMIFLGCLGEKYYIKPNYVIQEIVG